MVQLVDNYGALPVPQLPKSSKRLAAARLAAVFSAALAVAAVVAVVTNSAQTTVLYDGDPIPANLNDDQVKGIWQDTKEAWKDIDKVLPTKGGPWEDQNDPKIGYAFKNPGSVTSPEGWTGYYDTELRNGLPVLPEPNVNDVMGYDPTLSGTNVFWGDRGGQSVDNPAPWHNNEAMTVNQLSDGDYVPYSWVHGGPSHSALGDKGWEEESPMSYREGDYSKAGEGSGEFYAGPRPQA